MRSFAISFLLMFGLAAVSLAATLDEYRQRLDHAADTVTRVDASLDATGRAQQTDLITGIRRDVPAKERVEWSGGSVETDNAWVGTALDDLKNQTSRAKRQEILDGIWERLRATSTAVGELQHGLATQSTKDAEKQKLAEILSRPEYQPPVEEQESLFQRWWREFSKWIDSLFPKPQIAPSNVSGLGSLRLVLQIVIFAVVIALVAFLLWKFLPYFSARFSRKKGDGRGDRVILGEIVDADVSASDIFAEAEALARTGDMRGAIRKGYIAVLCELGDRRVVRLARHKTNRDYLGDVRRTPVILDGLRGLTDSFERNWYGIKDAKTEDWDKFREGYNTTLREAR